MYFLLLSTELDGKVEKPRYILKDLMTNVINFTGRRKIFSEFYIWNMENIYFGSHLASFQKEEN